MANSKKSDNDQDKDKNGFATEVLDHIEKENKKISEELEKEAIDTDTEEEKPKKNGTNTDKNKSEEPKPDQSTPEEEEADDLLDEILDDHYNNEHEEEEPEPEEEEDEFEFYEEDGSKQYKKGEERFEGIRIADIITAEMAIQYYENFLVKVCKIIARVMKHPREIHEDEIRCSSEIHEMSATLLDYYWSTIHIKINPVLAAFCLMTGATIINFSEALEKEQKEYKSNSRKRRKKKNYDEEDVQDVDFEEVKEEEKPGEDEDEEDQIKKGADNELKKVMEEANNIAKDKKHEE